MSATGTASSPPQQGGVEATLKDFWASRPRRPHHGRKVAGVAAAVGARYGIDPVVVRIALVTATIFGGSGLLLYVLGWLFFPDESDEVSAFESLIGKGRSRTSKHLTAVLCVAVFLTGSWGFSGSGWFGGSGFIGTALLLAALYLLHRNRGHLNRPSARTQEDYSMAYTVPAGAAQSAPGWDPLGAAPLAWELPDPNPPAPPPPEPAPPQPRRRKSRIGLATFGIALVVGAIGTALAGNDVSWFTPQHVVGLVLGVLGVGLVTGAFAGGGRGLIVPAIPLAIVGLVLTTTPLDDFGGKFGTVDATPRTAAEVRPEYVSSVGTVNLDLRQLPDDAVVQTRVAGAVGTKTVLVSPEADVTYTCRAAMGSVDCLGAQRDGIDDGPPLTGTELGDDGAGGPKITLDVSTGTGTVEVLRG